MTKQEIKNNPTMLPVDSNALCFALWKVIRDKYWIEDIAEKLSIDIEEIESEDSLCEPCLQWF